MAEVRNASDTVCPVCHSRAARRVSRKWWMRLISHSRYYSCSYCSSRFLTTAEERILVLRNGLRRGRKGRAAESTGSFAREETEHLQGGEQSHVVPRDSYRRQRTEMLLDLREELVPWMHKRFWVATGTTAVLALLLIHMTVRMMLTREFRAAATKAAESEQALQSMQAQVDFYKQLVTELDLQIRRSENALRQMEERIAAASAAIPVAATPAPSTASTTPDLGGGANNNTTLSPLAQSLRKELMLENAAYKVIVFTTGNRNSLLAEKVAERLQAENFRVTSARRAGSEAPRSGIEMQCTLEAAQKAREVREFVLRMAAVLGLPDREVTLRYSIAEGLTAAPPEKREIRIFF